MRFSPVAVTLVLNAALFAACSPGGSAPADPGAPAALALPQVVAGDLLYASEDAYPNSLVAIFSYPNGKPMNDITGVSQPRGLCSDARGNVFVTSYQSEVVFKFKRGATKPAATLSTANHAPFGCAVDPGTGTLAVTTDNGDVALFKNESGEASYVSYSPMSAGAFCTYDGSGNLFASGSDISGEFVLAELPAGSSTMKGITVRGVISPGLPMQWDGQYLALQTAQDFNKAVIERLRVSGSRTKLVGKIPLFGAANEYYAQFWIANGVIFAPYSDGDSIGVWNYPAGGKPTQTIATYKYGVVGITLSVKEK